MFRCKRKFSTKLNAAKQEIAWQNNEILARKKNLLIGKRKCACNARAIIMKTEDRTDCSPPPPSPLPPPPQKKKKRKENTIELLGSITFTIVNYSEYALES